MADRALFLVTGATGGVGQALCLELGRRGYRVGVCHRPGREALAARVAKQCAGVPLPLELADPATIAGLVARLAGTPAVLAGVALLASPPPRPCRFGQITPEEMAQFWQVNVAGPQQLLAGLVKAKWQPVRRGAVLAVLSAAMGEAGEPAMARMGAYAISKYGLRGVLRLLEANYPWLTVHAVSPGFVETPMLAAFDDRLLQQFRDAAPFLAPDQVAAALMAGLDGDRG